MATWQDVLDAVTSFDLRLDSKLDSKFRELALQMNARFDALEERLDRLKLPILPL